MNGIRTGFVEGWGATKTSQLQRARFTSPELELELAHGPTAINSKVGQLQFHQVSRDAKSQTPLDTGTF